jgi:two-component system, LytTR family, response regulator
MSEIRCIIVEDEPLAVKVLCDYIARVPFLKLKGTFKDAILATEYLQDHEADLIFLDIHLPKLRGMAFLKTRIHPPAVIITTAYHQYAVDAFNLNVTDYLLKPFEFERFLVAVNKVRTPEVQYHNESETKNYLFLNVQKKKVKILFSDIIYIESKQEYIQVVTTGKTFLSKLSTAQMESLLPSTLFKRIHRSYIISLSKINSYNAEVVEVAGYSLPISRTYRNVLDNL